MTDSAQCATCGMNHHALNNTCCKGFAPMPGVDLSYEHFKKMSLLGRQGYRAAYERSASFEMLEAEAAWRKENVHD